MPHPANSLAAIVERHQKCLRTDFPDAKIIASLSWLRENEGKFEWYIVIWRRSEESAARISTAVCLGKLTPRQAKSVFDTACEELFEGDRLIREGEYIDRETGNWFGSGFYDVQHSSVSEDIQPTVTHYGFCLYREQTRLFRGIWKKIEAHNTSFRLKYFEESRKKLLENRMVAFDDDTLLAKAILCADEIHYKNSEEILVQYVDSSQESIPKKNKGGRPKGSGKTVNDRLRDYIEKYPHEYGKTAEEFARILSCSDSAIKQTLMWKSLVIKRQNEKRTYLGADSFEEGIEIREEK